MEMIHKGTLSASAGGCWFCKNDGSDLFSYEFDTWLHSGCLIEALKAGKPDSEDRESLVMWRELGEAVNEPTGDMVVWTKAYRPFILGGNVHAPIATTVAVGPKYSLGKDLCGYLVISPKGETFVADAETGAFVGPSLEAVRADVWDGDAEVMQQQLAEAAKAVKGATYLSPEQFWRSFL